MSDPIEDFIRFSHAVVTGEGVTVLRSTALEALAVLRGRLAEAEAAEASVVSLNEALREIAERTSYVSGEDYQPYIARIARAALASSEGTDGAG
jgi:hypothetical protein